MAKSTCEFIDETIFNHGDENDHRQKSNFTDVILCCNDGTKFQVHKIIIATRCPYFAALFRSGLKETLQNEIQLGGEVSSEFFDDILEYIYTGKIQINCQNAEILNETAGFLQLTKLQEKCSEFLVHLLNLNNCLKFWRNAAFFGNSKLEENSIQYILNNFEPFIEKNLFELNFNEIVQVFATAACSDEILYSNLIRWIKADYDNRELFLEKLLNLVDYTKISDEFKQNIFEDFLSTKNEEFKKIFSKYILCPKPKPNRSQQEITNSSTQEMIFAVSRNDIFIYDHNTLKGLTLIPIFQHDLKYEKSYRSCIKVKPFTKSILFFDWKTGINNKMFSLSEEKMFDISTMIEKRENYGIIGLQKKIYVCGGKNNKGTVEYFDSNRNEWFPLPRMQKHQDYNFEIVEYNGSIFTFGGQFVNIIFKVPNKKVQRFDPRENIWEIVSNNSPNLNLIEEIFCENQNIYCLDGGHDLLSYNIREKKWEILSIQDDLNYAHNIGFCYNNSSLNVLKQYYNHTSTNSFAHYFFSKTNLSDLRFDADGDKKVLSVQSDVFKYFHPQLLSLQCPTYILNKWM